eukprot:Pgem_evm1s9775
MFFLLHVLLYILALSRVGNCEWTPWSRALTFSPTHHLQHPIWLNERQANSGDPKLPLFLRSAYH